VPTHHSLLHNTIKGRKNQGGRQVFAVVIAYPTGKRDLIDFASCPEEAEEIIETVCRNNGGRQYLYEKGVRFQVELAF